MKGKKLYRLTGILLAAVVAASGGAAVAGAGTVYAASASSKTAAKKSAKPAASKKSTAKSGKKSTAKKTARKVTYASAYQNVLKDYLNGKNDFDYGGLATNMKSPYGDVPQNPEFGLLDFNADGRPELLVGDNWDYGPAGWMMYSFDGKSAKAAGMVTGYDPNTGGFICAEDGGWVLYNYDGSNLIETAEMWGDDGTGEQVGYYPVQGDGMVLTSAAANAIAAQYQPIANLVPVTALNQTNVSAVK